ncbi:MAG TPA: hypothetical protein PLR47_07210, partial [Smithellaceae bacterium]|nr:hypothetical protein [Smithellaceae bacterium]
SPRMAYLIDIRLFLFAWRSDYIFIIYLSTTNFSPLKNFRSKAAESGLPVDIIKLNGITSPV